MSTQDQINWLREHLKGLLKRYQADRNRHKHTALWVKIAVAILASTATVLLGWTYAPLEDVFKNIALALNALITIVTAYEAFFEPRKLWVKETEVFSKLKDLERDLLFELEGNANVPANALEAYKNRITEILKESLSGWTKDKGFT